MSALNITRAGAYILAGFSVGYLAVICTIGVAVTVLTYAAGRALYAGLRGRVQRRARRRRVSRLVQVLDDGVAYSRRVRDDIWRRAARAKGGEARERRVQALVAIIDDNVRRGDLDQSHG